MDKVLCGLAGVAESCSVWEWITTDEKPYSRPLILFFRLSLYVCIWYFSLDLRSSFRYRLLMKPRGYGQGGSNWNNNRYGGYGRGKGMTRPAWFTDGKGKGNGFGGKGGNDSESNFGGRRSDAWGDLSYDQPSSYAPSMVAPISREELASPPSGSVSRNQNVDDFRYANLNRGYNREVSRSDIETFMQRNMLEQFVQNNAKREALIEFFLSNGTSFRIMEKLRGKKLFGVFVGYIMALDFEMQAANMHHLFHFLLDILFPKDGSSRPLRQNDLTILDFLMSDHFKNAVLRAIRLDPNFLGGSTYFTAELEKLKDERRKHPQMKKPGKNDSACSSSSQSAAGSGSGVGEKRDLDDVESASSNPFDSPEWDKKTMQKMLLKMMSKMPKTPEAEVQDGDEDKDHSMETRSGGKGKNKAKKQKKQG